MPPTSVAAKQAKRIRDRAYRRKAYAKKKEMRGKLFDIAEPVLRTASFLHSEIFSAPMDEVNSFIIKRLLKEEQDLKMWKQVLVDEEVLRVLVRPTYVSQVHPMWVRGKSTRHALTIKPEDEIGRSWTIQFRSLQTKEWFSLFDIKPSGIEGAGYGLFAARPFLEGATLGVFYGDVKDDVPCLRKTFYAMEVNWPPDSETGKKLIVDPGGGVETNLEFYRPCYFGLHFANDPNWGGIRRNDKRRTRQTLQPNFAVNISLVATATRDITVGEELFLDYGGSEC
jgi:hypothetical protein